MGFFKRDKKEESRNLVIFDELGIIHAKIVRFEAEIERLHQLFKALNGRVNKKLGYNTNEETETNKNLDGFDMFRL